jgi:hypothetical protein
MISFAESQTGQITQVVMSFISPSPDTSILGDMKQQEVIFWATGDDQTVQLFQTFRSKNIRSCQIYCLLGGSASIVYEL